MTPTSREILEAEHRRYLIREENYIRSHQTGKALHCRNAAAEIRKDLDAAPVPKYDRVSDVIGYAVIGTLLLAGGYMLLAMLTSG